MEHSSGKQNKARKGNKSVLRERERMYSRIEQKFEISQKEIRDHHKKFMREQKTGEMSKADFLKYADSERIKPFVAQSLFRWDQDDSPHQNKDRLTFQKCFRVFDEDGSGTIDFEEFIMIVNFKNSSTYEDKLGTDISAIRYLTLSFSCVPM